MLLLLLCSPFAYKNLAYIVYHFKKSNVASKYLHCLIIEVIIGYPSEDRSGDSHNKFQVVSLKSLFLKAMMNMTCELFFMAFQFGYFRLATG